MELVRSYDSILFGLPSFPGGSAPALLVSGPAQRSLTLRPARSPSRLCDPLHLRLQQFRCLHYCSDCYRVERTSSRAGIPPLWTGAFHGARESRLDRNCRIGLEEEERFPRSWRLERASVAVTTFNKFTRFEEAFAQLLGFLAGFTEEVPVAQEFLEDGAHERGLCVFEYFE